MRRCCNALCLLWMGLYCLPLFGTTWYVRPDGGTRFSANVRSGQCDGKGDNAYSGRGTNQHCAFKEARLLWTDGTYEVNAKAGAPTWGWIGAGGDTYLLRGSIGGGVAYPVGQNGPGTKDYFGLAGDPFSAGAPPPPSGTASEHTRILGENYAACHAPSARTQLYGRFGVKWVLNLSGVSYVDVACLDMTDHSSCGENGQQNACNRNPGTLSDFAKAGIVWSNKSVNDTVNDVRIHGMGSEGMSGPTGNGIVMRYVDLVGNASSGWNADNGDGTTGTGAMLMQHFNISWNGCAEEYPLSHALPYTDCTDDNGGGYGDGFGTATVQSNPGWTATFDQGLVSYNTQDGLDALHLTGAGSSMTITHTVAYGNMGQQIKVGGSFGTASGNTIVGNCNALRQPIVGTPPGYNARLSDFCRAGDSAVAMSVNNDRALVFTDNTIYSANATAIEIYCDTTRGECDKRAQIEFRDNTFVGFLNDVANGYPAGGTGDYSNPIFNGSGADPFTNQGSIYSGNTTFRAKSNWRCPARGETNAHCGDPHLVDETWHLYGIGNMSHSSGVGDAEAPKRVSSLQSLSESRRAALGCLFAGVLVTAAWQGSRLGPGR